ncbi:MAG: biopolymer transporter ExbD [Verrucomicrobiota bacterium]
MNFRKQAKQEPLGFQLAPMIDVMFLLLCFFVSSQMFAKWEQEVDITLPTADTSEIKQGHQGEVTINVNPAGQFIILGKILDEETLSKTLQKLARNFPGQAILIRADRQTAYEYIMKLLDLCRMADIWNISFATNPGSSEE